MDCFKTRIEAVVGLEKWAERDLECKRKGVGAEAFSVDYYGALHSLSRHRNGPTEGWLCSNEQGNCGCSHAEPKVVLDLLRRRRPEQSHFSLSVLGTSYSPCTRCAHVIIESRLFDVCEDCVIQIKRRHPWS